MFVEHPVALARADKNFKNDIPWISVSAVGMFLGSPNDIQRIRPMSEIDIFWTSTGLTYVGCYVGCGMLCGIGTTSDIKRQNNFISIKI